MGLAGHAAFNEEKSGTQRVLVGKP